MWRVVCPRGNAETLFSADGMGSPGASMGTFEGMIAPVTGGGLRAEGIETMQVNVGLRCNQSCFHCHHLAGPGRTETMDWPTMELALAATRASGARVLDITGGAPELNPDLERLLDAVDGTGLHVMVRTNLTVLTEDGLARMVRVYRDHGVHLIASFPCFMDERVCRQRGPGVLERSVEGMRLLNEAGYGREEGLVLDLIQNPIGARLPPPTQLVQEEYEHELCSRWGLVFDNVLTIANMPVGRFREGLAASGELDAYMDLLRSTFNPEAVPRVMCRTQVNVGWDGTLYDCDFNQAAGMPVGHGAPAHIREFDARALAGRRIVTAEHCFGCTAGMGSSCTGAFF